MSYRFVSEGNKILPDIILSDLNLDIRFQENIGAGSFGAAYLYVSEIDRKRYIVKFSYPNERAKPIFESEIDTLLSVYERLLTPEQLNSNICPEQILCYKYKIIIDPIKNPDEYALVIKQLLKFKPKKIDDNFAIYGIVSEYIPGDILLDRIKKYFGNKQKTLDFIDQLTSIVKRLHDVDVIHRDIKAENIIISGDKVYLIDFGFACLLDKCTDIPGSAKYAPLLLIKYMLNTRNIKFYKYQDVFAIMVCIWITDQTFYPFVSTKEGKITKELRKPKFHHDGITEHLVKFFTDYIDDEITEEEIINIYTIDHIRAMFGLNETQI